MERDLKLQKRLLKMKTTELIKECRTRALDTDGTKLHLIGRLDEYLDKEIKKASHPAHTNTHSQHPATAKVVTDASEATTDMVHRESLDWLDV